MVGFNPKGEFIMLNETRRVYLIDPIPSHITYDDIVRIMEKKELITIGKEEYYIVGVEADWPQKTKCGIMVSKEKPE